jgi:hypothetical protein
VAKRTGVVRAVCEERVRSSALGYSAGAGHSSANEHDLQLRVLVRLRDIGMCSSTLAWSPIFSAFLCIFN